MRSSIKLLNYALSSNTVVYISASYSESTNFGVDLKAGCLRYSVIFFSQRT